MRSFNSNATLNIAKRRKFVAGLAISGSQFCDIDDRSERRFGSGSALPYRPCGRLRSDIGSQPRAISRPTSARTSNVLERHRSLPTRHRNRKD